MVRLCFAIIYCKLITSQKINRWKQQFVICQFHHLSLFLSLRQFNCLMWRHCKQDLCGVDRRSFSSTSCVRILSPSVRCVLWERHTKQVLAGVLKIWWHVFWSLNQLLLCCCRSQVCQYVSYPNESWALFMQKLLPARFRILLGH